MAKDFNRIQDNFVNVLVGLDAVLLLASQSLMNAINPIFLPRRYCLLASSKGFKDKDVAIPKKRWNIWGDATPGYVKARGAFACTGAIYI